MAHDKEHLLDNEVLDKLDHEVLAAMFCLPVMAINVFLHHRAGSLNLHHGGGEEGDKDDGLVENPPRLRCSCGETDALQFSKRTCDRHVPPRCRSCVKAEVENRQAAQREYADSTVIHCRTCENGFPLAHFSVTQRRKPKRKRRCQACAARRAEELRAEELARRAEELRICQLCQRNSVDQDCTQCARRLCLPCGGGACDEYGGKPHQLTPRENSPRSVHNAACNCLGCRADLHASSDSKPRDRTRTPRRHQ